MAANTPQSRKAKGRRLQQHVVKAILECFPELTKDDVWSTSMGAPGRDIKLSTKALTKFPFSSECKNKERLDLWGSLKQARENAEEYEPALIFTRNREDVYIAIRFEAFMEILKHANISWETVKEGGEI